jgi:hypothetical protein
VRAVVRDQAERTIIHVYNLNVKRSSSFDDEVTPADDVKLTATVPFQNVRSVTIHSADEHATSGPIPFTADSAGNGSQVAVTIPRLVVSAILVVAR